MYVGNSLLTKLSLFFNLFFSLNLYFSIFFSQVHNISVYEGVCVYLPNVALNEEFVPIYLHTYVRTYTIYLLTKLHHVSFLSLSLSLTLSQCLSLKCTTSLSMKARVRVCSYMILLSSAYSSQEQLVFHQTCCFCCRRVMASATLFEMHFRCFLQIAQFFLPEAAV